MGAAVAQALQCDPAILIADEITSALDPGHRREVLTVVDVRRWRRGTAMFEISPDQGMAAEVADRVVVLDDGVVLKER